MRKACSPCSCRAVWPDYNTRQCPYRLTDRVDPLAAEREEAGHHGWTPSCECSYSSVPKCDTHPRGRIKYHRKVEQESRCNDASRPPSRDVTCDGRLTSLTGSSDSTRCRCSGTLGMRLVMSVRARDVGVSTQVCVRVCVCVCVCMYVCM